MIKVLLFDFAGVIGADGYWVWLKENVPNLESRRPYFQNLSEKIDRAEITDKEFVEAVAQGANISIEIIKKEIFKKIIINKELLDLIIQLKKRYKIGLLTNYHHKWMNELFKIYDLGKYFDGKIVSSLHGVIKPDPRIYKIALNLFKIKPEEAIFIDDRQNNVDGGENAGIKSVLFTTNSKLMEDLKKFEVKI